MSGFCNALTAEGSEARPRSSGTTLQWQASGTRPKVRSITENIRKIDIVGKVVFRNTSVVLNGLFLLLSISFLSILGSMMVGNGSCYATTETFGDSSASLTLDTSNVEVLVEPGTKGYASKSITIQASNTKDYALTITAPAILSKENDTTNKANSWGYAYGQSGDLDTMTYTNFTGTTQTLTSGSGNVNDSKTLAITADFTNNPSSGHYKAEINLALTVTPRVATTYSITYNANGGSGTPSPASQSIESYDDTYTFTAASQGTLAKTGYNFLGWSESSAATTATYTAGSSTITLAKNSPSQVLYAVWKKIMTWNDLQYLQDMNPSACSGAPSKTAKTLTDLRDGNSYTIAKLDDGKCWMTQNLRIIGKTLTPTDSNVEQDYIIPNTTLSSWTNHSSDANYANYSNNTSYGTYYSWYAATAGTLSSDYSVCPLGWRLPTNSEFSSLLTAAGITSDASGASKIQGAPYNFPLSRNVADGAYGSSGRGYWWSSTKAGTIIYVTYIRDSETVAASGMSALYNGNTIRCIAQS